MSRQKNTTERVIQYLNAYLFLDKSTLYNKVRVKAPQLDIVLDTLFQKEIIKTTLVEIDRDSTTKVYYLSINEKFVQVFQNRKIHSPAINSIFKIN